MSQVRVSRFSGLDNDTLYALLRLRVDVFVVEQSCPYPELDGRDTEADTLHVWLQEGADVLGCLRLLDDGGEHRIGRVCVAVEARGRGVAEELVQEALRHTDGAVVLDAQAHLAAWYERLGFVIAGQRFVEDGIPHVPMRLAGRQSPVRPAARRPASGA